MESYDLNSWSELSQSINSIRTKYGHHARSFETSGKSATWTQKNRILFRGQANSEWSLQTTLERRSSSKFSILEYTRRAHSCVHELESYTGKNWNLKIYPEIKDEILRCNDSMRSQLACYEYLVHLRHHGFPSPLLDWTESPHIAAFFAFCEPSGADRVAIYAYIETVQGSKSMTGGSPMITVQGPYATTHPRHFAQKAWYTISTRWSHEDKRHIFCPHDDVFKQNETEQDVLIRITLPSTERISALRELSDYNINHFTLFQSEDALVKALAIKQFDVEPEFLIQETPVVAPSK